VTDPDKSFAPLTLLEPGEPPAFEIVNPKGANSLVLLCDHASSRVPRRLNNLGLEIHQLKDHIGWDPGAAEVARQLSQLIDAPLLLSGYSRLVIDCNRPLYAWDSIAQESAGVTVPGNVNLAQEQIDSRRQELFRPYHQAISRFLDNRAGSNTQLLSVHSFTPVLLGRRRPWSIGVCYGHDNHFALMMLQALAGSVEGEIGDNEPYAIEDDTDYTIPVHGEARGLPSIMIEIRQDGLRTEQGVTHWSSQLAAAWLQIEARVQQLG
jgi:predicted N-formylglutamate amidohydrolase